jgi:hypothetical protein
MLAMEAYARQDIKTLLKIMEGYIIRSDKHKVIADIRDRWVPKPKREMGFYWVRFSGGSWQPARWDGTAWSVALKAYTDEDFAECAPACVLIGPAVYPYGTSPATPSTMLVSGDHVRCIDDNTGPIMTLEYLDATDIPYWVCTWSEGPRLRRVSIAASQLVKVSSSIQV